MRISQLVLAVGGLISFAAQAGPFAPAAGQPGSTAVSMASPAIVAWANGYSDYLPGANVDAAWRTPEKSLGAAQGTSTDVVVLGDRGSLTLTFAGALFDGPGSDFAVFENGFADNFLELAWVEVSSDGSQFHRFPAYSFTANPVGGFGTLDPTNVDGLAGKYRQGWGTPFDLALLAGRPGLDLNDVRFVRIVDIVGDGSALDDYPVAFGGPHPIYDPYPTVISGGFDLDAVAAMNFHAAPVPEPATYALFGLGALLVGQAARRCKTR